jgi:aspartyl aminopeptidase
VKKISPRQEQLTFFPFRIQTWFDRDLGLSGRVFVRSSAASWDSDNSGGGGQKIEQRLVKIDRALLRISNLAIHLQTAKEREAFAYNKEDHLSPILAMEVKKALTGTTTTTNDDNKKDDSPSATSTENDGSSSISTASKKDGWTEHQEPALLEILAHELGLENANDIVDFELNLFDIQKAVIGGAFGEFVHSARLDNLASCFMAVQALVDYVSPSSTDDEDGNGSLLDEDEGISMICLYDHEEVGSSSAVGAASPILTEAIRRICSAAIQQASESSPLSFEEVHRSCIAKSFALSSDQAHAVHPNYASKHEKAHQPKMNDGMVIKRNSNQRYATTPVTGLLMREIAKRAGLPPLQEFLVRQDCGCGSTIGPIMSTLTGIRTIDMGCPQLSMHSIRETMGTCDLTFGRDLFKAYFRYFNEVDKSVESS